MPWAESSGDVAVVPSAHRRLELYSLSLQGVSTLPRVTLVRAAGQARRLSSSLRLRPSGPQIRVSAGASQGGATFTSGEASHQLGGSLRSSGILPTPYRF